MPKEVNNFWKPGGYSDSLKRIINGVNSVKLLEEYLRERAKISDNYAVQLNNLATNWCKKIQQNGEYGTIKEGWMELLDETNKEALIYHNMPELTNNRIKDNFKEWYTTNVKKRNHYKEMKKSFVAIEKQWLKLVLDVNSKKKLYLALSDRLNAINKNQKMLPKYDATEEDKKKQAKYTQVVDAQKKSEKTYKDSFDALQSAKDQFQEDMESAFKKCQEFEECRIDFIKSNLDWFGETLEDSLIQKTTPIYSKYSQELDKINPTEDLEYWNKFHGPSAEFPEFKLEKSNVAELRNTGKSTTRSENSLSNKDQKSESSISDQNEETEQFANNNEGELDILATN